MVLDSMTPAILSDHIDNEFIGQNVGKFFVDRSIDGRAFMDLDAQALDAVQFPKEWQSFILLEVERWQYEMKRDQGKEEKTKPATHRNHEPKTLKDPTCQRLLSGKRRRLHEEAEHVDSQEKYTSKREHIARDNEREEGEEGEEKWVHDQVREREFKRRVAPGQKTWFFDAEKNQPVPAKIVNLVCAHARG